MTQARATAIAERLPGIPIAHTVFTQGID